MTTCTNLSCVDGFKIDVNSPPPPTCAIFTHQSSYVEHETHEHTQPCKAQNDKPCEVQWKKYNILWPACELSKRS